MTQRDDNALQSDGHIRLFLEELYETNDVPIYVETFRCGQYPIMSL